MAELKNTVEILKLLNKTNCRRCGEKTCLAFAASVFQGKRELGECPHVEEDILALYGGKVEKRKTMEDGFEVALSKIKEQIAGTDLESRADAVGGVFENGRLTIKILGKDFHVYEDGRLSSDIHMLPWVIEPVLSYILTCKGLPLTGNWVPFRELNGAKEMNGLFVKRGEEPLKNVADKYTDLFSDMIQIFNGREVEKHFDADISLVLYPLPRLPILICYLKPEDGLESDLKLFFDSTAADNLSVGSVYRLGTGLTMMFEKLSLRHGA